MRQRLLLCILLTLALAYFAIPRLPIVEEGLGQLFSAMWLLFAFVVIGGNLSSLLYFNKREVSTQFIENRQKVRKKSTIYSS